MTEFPTPELMQQPPERRPTMHELRERIVQGERIYSVIGAAVKIDTAIIASHTQRFLAAKDNLLPPPLDPDIVRLYDLPTEKTEDELVSYHDVGFQAGFSHVTKHLYPMIDAAYRPPSPSQPHNLLGDPVVQEFFDRVKAANPDQAKEIMAQLEADRILAGEGRQYIRTALDTDHSGVTWLSARAALAFHDGPTQLTGARRAITGISKLHARLFEK